MGEDSNLKILKIVFHLSAKICTYFEENIYIGQIMTLDHFFLLNIILHPRLVLSSTLFLSFCFNFLFLAKLQRFHILKLHFTACCEATSRWTIVNLVQCASTLRLLSHIWPWSTNSLTPAPPAALRTPGFSVQLVWYCDSRFRPGHGARRVGQPACKSAAQTRIARVAFAPRGPSMIGLRL
jgi:hypothetical protein